MVKLKNKKVDPFAQRRAGILLHPTSLPGPENQGIFGHDAYRFVEFLAQAGFSIWQTLPLGPTHEDNSPYQCLSAHACDPKFISIDWLIDHEMLDKKHLHDHSADKKQLINQAYHKFGAHLDVDQFLSFKNQHAFWLDDYSVFMALRETHNNKPWWQWDDAFRDNIKKAVNAFIKTNAAIVDYYRFEQYILFSQWLHLKKYANEKGILIFGDMPIYVALDSADVWANRKMFTLDKTGLPVNVAGVPPDYFSETGQRWGNPIYNWDKMKKDNFHWWSERIQSQYELFDLIRIDHFRGLDAYWSIPSKEETAINGEWIKAPGEALLSSLKEQFGNLPLVAEDLGTITESVHKLRKKFKIPGMEVLQFAFDGDPNNLYLPHNHEADMIVYTGTHDNNTTVGWFEDLSHESRSYVCQYLIGGNCEMPWSLNRSALASVARTAILPMQDVLGLGRFSRMNTPGTTEGNWSWRFDWSQLHDNLANDLRYMNRLYGRSS